MQKRDLHIGRMKPQLDVDFLCNKLQSTEFLLSLIESHFCSDATGEDTAAFLKRLYTTAGYVRADYDSIVKMTRGLYARN